MPRCKVLQPNGLFAIWSTVVDDFTLLDATAGEAILDELDNPSNAGYPGGKDGLRRDLCREFENITTTGKAWKWSPTWEEAIETIRNLHGDEVANKRLDAIQQEQPHD